jgi:hypothetical protein
MRHILAIIGIVVLGIIALKVLFWTLKYVILLAIIGGGAYFVLQSGWLRRKS